MAAADVNDEELTQRTDAPAEEPDPRRRGLAALIALVMLLLLACCCWAWSLRVAVPNVVGMTEQDARATLEKAGFNAMFTTEASGTASAESANAKPGTAISQSPKAGKKYIRGTTVEVTMNAPAEAGTPGSGYSKITTLPDISTGPGRPGVSTSSDGEGAGVSTSGGTGPLVPSAQNMSEAAAKAALTGAGYRVVVGGYHSTTAGVLAGNVWYQNPAPGAVAARGTTVTIWLSTGAPNGTYATEPYPVPRTY